MTSPPERNESDIETDICIYGATSFVARHVLNYLADVGPSLPRKLKITLAGRDQAKLTKVSESFAPLLTVDVRVAESANATALGEMAGRSRVVLNCAGPFELYSGGVVAACAETGCDYVDITGEVHWVGDMRVKYGSASEKSGSRIVSLCGFDSIPSDLAVFAAVQALRKEVQDESTPLEIETARTWHVVMGMAGGGTLATAKNMEINLGKCLFQPSGSPRKVPWMCFDPLVLTHPNVRFSPEYEATRDRLAWTEWLNMLPYPHTIFQQGVSIPFFMAVANAKVVHASAIALNYGPKFTYQERWLPLGFHWTLRCGALSSIPALIVLWFVALAGLVLKLPHVGDLMLKWFAPPGTGASDTLCRMGFAQVYAEVKSAPLPNSSGEVACANAHLEFQGDPGNFVTAQCAVESALSLIFHRPELPPRSGDGFGTPAELLGPVLLDRLANSKVRPVKVTTNVRDREQDHEYKVYLSY